MATPILALDGVTKRYGPRTALQGVGFALAAGEAVGYLGPNGAGKTTTLKLLAGLARPDEGTVRILGRDPAAGGAAALERVGALIETPGIAPFLHGRDLLGYVAEIKDVPRADRGAEIARAAASMGVGDHLDRPVGGLSTGLLRRVWIAAALVGRPDVLLLDEPTLGLDPVARRDLRQVLKTLHRDGTALLVSTHLLDDVEEVCDRVVFLREGRVVGDEPVRPRADAPDAPGVRRVRVRFAADVPTDRLATALAGDVRIESWEGREATLVLTGSEVRQAEVLAGIVRAGFPLSGARPVGDALTDRYLAAVGREDDP